MKTCFSKLYQAFPIRHTKGQKEAFEKYIKEQAEAVGFEAKTEILSQNRNIVIGNIKTAKVVFAAHYDTPWAALFPNLLLPRARGLYYAYQFLIILGVLIPAVFAALCTKWLVPLDYEIPQNLLVPLAVYLFVYYLLFFLTFRGFINKHNANDNTSGVCTVLEIMKRLSGSDNAAFVLFDNEERGKKGSKAFFKEHEEVFLTKPVVNFDCVGVGEYPVFILKDAFDENSGREAFLNKFASMENANVFSSVEAKSNSDHLNFPRGIAVMMCKRSKRGILYTDKIHTSRDTDVSEENILALSEAASEFAIGMEVQR